jgi:hypothetical protein
MRTNALRPEARLRPERGMKQFAEKLRPCDMSGQAGGNRIDRNFYSGAASPASLVRI